jgi:6-phosphogluconolactonase
MINTITGHLEVCADADAVAQGVADRIIASAAAAIAARGRFVIALAGGSSPREAYTLLSQSPRREQIAWDKLVVLFGDERCVPPTDDDSNYKMATETLLSHVPVPADNILRMRGEDMPAVAATEYAELLTAHLGATPIIDFVLLGLGPDAHTASWFPGVVINDHVTVDAPYVPKFSGHRLTLTPPVINAAREIIVATSGSGKAEALASALSNTRNPLHVPSQRLHPSEGTLTWLVDTAAAAKVNP